MADIAEIMDMIDWHMPSEIRIKGVSLARDTETIIPFIQPLTPEHNKNVWEGCAVIIVEKSDENLKPYIGKEVVAGIRPELLHDEPIYLGQFPDSTIEAYVDFTELMGAEIYLYLSLDEETNVISRVSSRSTAKGGDTIKIAIDTTRIHFFDKDTEQIIVH